MVGRFVEQQQVRSLPGDQGQRQAGLLTTGEVHHRLVDAIAMEVEATQEVAQGLLTLGGGNALQVQQRAGLVVQRIQLVLGEVAHGQVLTPHQAARQWLELACEVLDQGRLASAVGAEQANARTGGELQLDLVEDRLVTVAQAAFGQAQQRAGDFLRLAENEVERRIDMRRR
ncbi:hypothetical protein D3C72_994100 [compost metagenome]